MINAKKEKHKGLFCTKKELVQRLMRKSLTYDLFEEVI